MAKGPSRAQERKRQLDAAASIELPDACDVVVWGGGAAGLVAAICAAEAGATVVVLERDLTCGRPILATGNGRCNFAHAPLDPQRYNDPQFVGAVCGGRWLDDVLGFFHASGLRWCLEEDRLYPSSRQAASVRNVLLARARRAGVTLAPARTVTGVALSEGHVDVSYSEAFAPDGITKSCRARAVVVACGGAPAPALGHLPLATTPALPVLCPLACEESPLASLDGRRAHAEVSLTRAGSSSPIWHERGEVLLRSYGLSGIVVFDCSRRAAAGDLIELDLAPDLSRPELSRLVDPRAQGSFDEGCLDGVLDPTIARTLERLARERWHISWPGHPAPASAAEALTSLAKALPFRVVGPADAHQAQVMRGGLCTDQFDPSTLAARALPRLFACGEALAVDGDCGGFNLAWAWKSGMVAGTAAARQALAQEVAP